MALKSLRNPVDVTVAASGTSGGLNSGTVTTTQPNDLTFGAGVIDNPETQTFGSRVPWAGLQNARCIGNPRAGCNDFTSLSAHQKRRQNALTSLD
jgi:hypothetical protein